MARKKRKKFGGKVQVVGDPWIYRRPLEQGGKWRVDRRHVGTGQVERVTLESKNYTDAFKEVQKKARREIEEAKAAREAVVVPQVGTVAAVLAEWLSKVVVREDTKTDYEASVEVYKRAFGAARTFGDVTLAEVEKLLIVDMKDRAGRTCLKGCMHI